MALAGLRRAENVAGDMFVDSSCIDCDTCRWMAPSTFARTGGQSAVVAQPTSATQRQAAFEALVACPTASIGSGDKAAVAAAARAFPIPVAGSVFDCGYHSASSFGATSYFIRRSTPDGRPDNVLVDSPRFAEPLARRLEELGGVAMMVLTHRDDVADHAKFADRFGCRRVIHRRDAGRWAEGFELLDGDAPIEMGLGLTAVPTPGHTAGHVCFLWQDPTGERMLFTGDHLAYDDEADRLEAWPDVCWYDWAQQTASMRRLAGLDFDWVLPGHGRRGHLGKDRMREGLLRLVGWMEKAR